jgi:hypothetical protein
MSSNGVIFALSASECKYTALVVIPESCLALLYVTLHVHDIMINNWKCDLNFDIQVVVFWSKASTSLFGRYV